MGCRNTLLPSLLDRLLELLSPSSRTVCYESLVSTLRPTIAYLLIVSCFELKCMDFLFFKKVLRAIQELWESLDTLDPVVPLVR